MNNKGNQTEREFIEYRFSEVMKRLERMEQTMNGFAFVKQSEFDEFKREARELYATKEDVAPMKKVFYGILGASVVGIVGFVFWLAQMLVERAIS